MTILGTYRRMRAQDFCRSKSHYLVAPTGFVCNIPYGLQGLTLARLHKTVKWGSN